MILISHLEQVHQKLKIEKLSKNGKIGHFEATKQACVIIFSHNFFDDLIEGELKKIFEENNFFQIFCYLFNYKIKPII